MNLSAIIVDDEPLARSLLASILEEVSDLHVLALCANGYEAVEAVSKHAPDMMFLDIEMPEMNGFDVIKAIQAEMMPKIIFTTAYAGYAVEAFRVQALNYVLKPLDENAIKDSIDRVRQIIPTGAQSAQKSTLLSTLKDTGQSGGNRSLIVKDSDKISFLDKSKIDWVEADGDYVCIHSGPHTHLIRATLKSIEAQLIQPNFLRIHRSTVVNLDKIQEIRPAHKGEAVVIMQSGEPLKVSRRYGASLRAQIS